MKLRDLVGQIPGASLFGDGDVEVKEPRYDSRAVTEGDLFCAVVGEKMDGNRFVDQAVKAGAAAVLTSREDLVTDVPKIVVEDDRSGMAFAAHALYGDPTAKMAMIGITGTNGKTTCTHILESILAAGGHRAGRIGTVGWSFEGEGEELARTTPEAPDLLKLLVTMAGRGATHVVMEVTSIAVPMKRVEGFHWDGGLFTNLSQDHLDLHGSMEEYFAAKKAFFEMLDEGSVAVANLDDPRGAAMVEGSRGEVVTYALLTEADVMGEIVGESSRGIAMRISGRYGDFMLNAPYVGRFNAENVLACVAMALALEVPMDAIVKGVQDAPQVRGRMERLVLEDGVVAVIDYAHTPGAVENALQALRPMTDGRLIVVIGAGGDRDRTKRPIMGRIAGANADLAIITSDNPRTEDPDDIVKQVLAGVEGDNAEMVVDRREAIRRAIDLAEPGDTVLVAGKGHETYQEVDGKRHHFDDREEVLKIRRTA